LPSRPRIGEGIRPTTSKPTEATRAPMSSHTARCTASSRTTPFLACAGPASNCGFTRGEQRHDRRQHELQRDEAHIGDEEVDRLGNENAVEAAGIRRFEAHDPRITASFGWSWPWPTSTAYTLSAPPVRSTSVKRQSRRRDRGRAARADQSRRRRAPPRASRRRARPRDAAPRRRSPLRPGPDPKPSRPAFRRPSRARPRSPPAPWRGSRRSRARRGEDRRAGGASPALATEGELRQPNPLSSAGGRPTFRPASTAEERP
jgi:hypothetical protein